MIIPPIYGNIGNGLLLLFLHLSFVIAAIASSSSESPGLALQEQGGHSRAGAGLKGPDESLQSAPRGRIQLAPPLVQTPQVSCAMVNMWFLSLVPP